MASGPRDQTVTETPDPGEVRDPAHAETLASAAGGEAALVAGSWLAGRYQIVGFLGRGGMGAVYRAIDHALDDQHVALKLVSRSTASAIERLRREVRLAQKVTHPNACRIYDLEEAGDRWMIKMELVVGETLASRVARAPLAVAEALAVVRTIAEALGAAHRQGVVHRDLKPHNVMIEAGTERVVLMDFGIARHADVESDTGEGMVGTPAFMAPEQVRATRVDERTDLYALGCVLYHALVGEVPYPAATPMAAALRHVEDPVPDLRARRGEVPAWLARAVATLMAKDPASRPPDVEAALRLLAGPAARRRRWLRRVPVAVAVLAAGTAAFVIATRDQGRAAPPVWRPVYEAMPAYDENSDVPVLSPDGTMVAYTSDRDEPSKFRLYVAPLRGGEERVVSPPGANILRYGWFDDGSGLLATRVRDGLDLEVVRYVLDGTETAVGDAIFADDCGGRLVVFQSRWPGCETCVRLAVREGGRPDRELVRLPVGSLALGLRCDQAGEQVAYAVTLDPAGLRDRSELWVARLDGGAPRRLSNGGRMNGYPAFAPDGRSVVYASDRGGRLNVWEVSVDGGDSVQLTFGEGDDYPGDISADGRLLLFSADRTATPLFERTVDGGSPRRVMATRPILRELTVTPDGREVIAVDFSGAAEQVIAIDVATGTSRQLGMGHHVTLSVDGRDVVYATVDQPVRIVAVARDGGSPRVLAELDGRVHGLSAGPDGWLNVTRIVDDRCEAWRMPLAGGALARVELPAPWCFVVPAPRGGARMLGAFREASLVGTVLPAGAEPGPAYPTFKLNGGGFDARGEAFVYADGERVHRVDATTGVATVLFTLHNINWVAPSPDGRALYTAEFVAHVTRHILTNFADRPRP